MTKTIKNCGVNGSGSKTYQKLCTVNQSRTNSVHIRILRNIFFYATTTIIIVLFYLLEYNILKYVKNYQKTAFEHI